MHAITLENVPADLLARLEVSAVAHRRTLNQEILQILAQAMHVESTDDVEVLLASAAQIRTRIAATTGLPPVTEAFLQQAKRTGRA